MTPVQESSEPATNDESGVFSAIRGPTIFGAFVLTVFIGVFFVWGGFAPLAGGAIAPGLISPEGSRRTVQHLEGGIIETFEVRDGDDVQVGDPLVILRATQARAGFQVLLGQKRVLAAQRARLRSEQADLRAPVYPDWLLAEGDALDDVRELLDSQTELFERRAELHANRQSVVRQRIAQLDAEIAGLREQIDAQDRRSVLIRSEIEDISALVNKGLAPRPRLLALQREQASIDEQRAGAVAGIARAEQAIGESQVQILAADSQRLDEVAQELNEVQAELAEVNERLLASEDVLDRTVVTAPISGTVVNRRFTTTGGVIRPGEPILDIVPDDEALIIEARLSPLDIDSVQTGQDATVHLSALQQRNLPRVDGEVLDVSADALSNETTGESYFRVRVRVDRDQLAELGVDDEISVGMPAEVLILTGERTMLEYLVAPLSGSFRNAMREQ